MYIDTNCASASGYPIEVYDAQTMQIAMEANEGRVYRYMGEETSVFVHGAIYTVVVDD